MVYSCKMCGVSLELKKGISKERCPYCGMINTVPKPADVLQENQFDKANYHRRNHDYTRAVALYDMILSADETNAYAHWEKVLCKYGVEYISDLSSNSCVPVCNQMQPVSVFEDENYKAAMRHADDELKNVLETEAKAIDSLQKDLQEKAKAESSYDVFLCYREQGSDGSRTKDSELAEELYGYLKKNGFDVFYERECQKQHPDTTPYRCAALSDADAMVVLGSTKESFENPLVRNEWMAYQKRNSERQAAFIVAYRDMDSYELPDEMLHLQAKDMNKLGFMQELLDQLHALCDTRVTQEEQKEEEASNVNISAESLTERAFLCLEDGEFDKADELLEQALNCQAKYAKAYVGKLMIAVGVRIEEALAEAKSGLEKYKEYNRILRFGDAETRKRIEGYNKQIAERNAMEELSAKGNRYAEAEKLLEEEMTEQGYLNAARIYNELGSYKDSGQKYTYCVQTAARENKYQNAARLLHNSSYDEAESIFLQLADYKDAAVMAENCRKEKIYQSGLSLLGNRKYEKAAEVFLSLGEYKNAAEQVVRCQQRVDRETIEAQKNQKKEELQHQKEQIKSEIRSMGVFDGKKTRELYAKLDEVEDLIRELNDEQVFIVTEEEPEEETESAEVSPKDALLLKKEKIKQEIEKQGIFDGKRRKELFSQLDDIEDRIRELNDTMNQTAPKEEEHDGHAEQETAATMEATEMDRQELMEELRKKKDAIKEEIEQQGIFAGKRIKQLYGELDVVEDQIKDIHVEMNPYMEKKEETDILERPLADLDKDELRARKEEVKKELEEYGGVFDGKYRKELYAELDEIEERLKAFLEQ